MLIHHDTGAGYQYPAWVLTFCAQSFPREEPMPSSAPQVQHRIPQCPTQPYLHSMHHSLWLLTHRDIPCCRRRCKIRCHASWSLWKSEKIRVNSPLRDLSKEEENIQKNWPLACLKFNPLSHLQRQKAPLPLPHKSLDLTPFKFTSTQSRCVQAEDHPGLNLNWFRKHFLFI